MAIAWVLRDPRVTSALIGASRPRRSWTTSAALARLDFAPEELAEIDRHATEGGVDLWARPSHDLAPCDGPRTRRDRYGRISSPRATVMARPTKQTSPGRSRRASITPPRGER